MIQNRKERFRRKVGFTNAEITAIPNPIKNDRETPVSTVSENDISDKDFQGGRIVHNWFDVNDLRQKYVNYAYKVGGMDLVKLIECENAERNQFRKAYWKEDSWWFCMINRRWHKDIVDTKEFREDWKWQIDKCNELMKGGTKFYWRDRIIKGQKCKEYVEERFTYIE